MRCAGISRGWRRLVLTDYAVKRERRRAQRVRFVAPFVVVAFVFRLFAALGSGLVWLIYLPIGVLLVWLLASMFLAVHLDRFVILAQRPVGSWPAQVRARSFRRVVEKRPRMGPFAELLGRVTFGPDGTIVWVMGASNRMVFGPLEHAWTPPYRLCARRLKGPWRQVHVAIQRSPDGPVDDLWLRRAKGFPI